MKAERCIPYIRVKDARASLAYYERCLGFQKESEHQFEPGFPLCISVVRGGLHFFLTEHTGDGNFGICLYCYVNNVDELHRQFRSAGAREVSEIDDMPWGRDFSAKDLDGNQLRFGTSKQAPA